MEVGRKFLRCLIKQSESENLSDNAFRVLDCPVDFAEINSSLQLIYKFVRIYYGEIEDLPTFQLLEEEFKSRGEADALDELEDIKKLAAHTDKSFQFIINETVSEINKVKFNALIQDVAAINNSALKKNKRTLKGTKEALNYLLENSEQFHYSSNDEKTDSEMAAATQKALLRFETAKSNPLANLGVMSGINPIDKAIKGVKKKELLLIAGSVGECKSTLSMNWAYNAAVNCGWNVLFVTLEMSQENLEDIFYCMHANNPALQREVNCNIVIPFDDIRSGLTSPRKEAFYRYALKDWSERGMKRKGRKFPYGNLTVWQPNTTLTPSLLTAKCNYFDRLNRIDLLIVDYPGLMAPDNAQAYKNESAALNEIMKRLKQQALTFRNNEGLPIIAAFQINREGKKDVVKRTEKEDGEVSLLTEVGKPLYSSFHLSYANEAERSADYVIYTYLNKELRDSNTIHIGNIKNRHGSPFTPFLCSTALGTKRIWHDHTADSDIPTGKVMETVL